MAILTDDFSTDPAARWTGEGTTFAHDATDGEMDINTEGTAVRYTNADVGGIVHEAQVTGIVVNSGNRSVLRCACTMAVRTTGTRYTLAAQIRYCLHVGTPELEPSLHLLGLPERTTISSRFDSRPKEQQAPT
jgi:hypothetical protein